MKDVKGNEVAVGDEVVYIRNIGYDAKLDIGKVTKIYRNGHECSVDRKPHIYSCRILKTDALGRVGQDG